MSSVSTPYLRDFVLGPPFSAIVAILIVGGMARLGLWWISRGVDAGAPGATRSESPSAIDIALGFVVVVSLVATAVHAVAWLNVASLTSLRVLGAGLICANIWWCQRRFVDAVRAGWRSLVTDVSDGRWLARWTFAAATVTLSALLIGVLGPPTDADSLAYHLAVPLDWLQHGARPTPDWLHARLFGLGEALNLLGLATGTDCFGAVLQFAGGGVAIAVLMALARTGRDRTLAVAVVAGCPLLASLLLTSKAQLLPAAATTAVIAWVIDRRERGRPLSPAAIWACWSALSFAAASKYSFLLSAAPAAGILLKDIRSGRQTIRGIVIGVSAALVVAGPVFLRTLLWYGDPVSPLLEKFRESPDLIIATFAAYLRNFEMDHSFRHLVKAPLIMTWTFDPALFATVLGLGTLTVVLAFWCDRRDRDILLATLVTGALAIAGGQLQPRFLLEPMFWSTALVVSGRSRVGKSALSWVLGGQMIATTMGAVVVGWLYAPAFASQTGREAVLARVGADYGTAAWLNGILPPAAVVANDQRAVLYFERPSMSGDFARMVDLALLPRDAQRRILVAALQRHHVNTLIVHEPVGLSPFHDLIRDLGPPIATAAFEPASRQFWVEQPLLRVYAYRFTLE